MSHTELWTAARAVVQIIGAGLMLWLVREWHKPGPYGPLAHRLFVIVSIWFAYAALTNVYRLLGGTADIDLVYNPPLITIFFVVIVAGIGRTVWQVRQINRGHAVTARARESWGPLRRLSEVLTPLPHAGD